MTRFLLSCLPLLFTLTTWAQNFNGQWKGHFKVTGTEDRDDYMLELQTTDPTHVTGYSYTYFDEAGLHYFTICRVSGIIDRASKMVTVTELEKIKGNTPPGIRDCLQVHTLTYFRGEGGETLEGTWKPAPGFDYGCGAGTTALSRKMLVKTVKPSAKAGAVAGAKPHTGVTPHTVTGGAAQSASSGATVATPHRKLRKDTSAARAKSDNTGTLQAQSNAAPALSTPPAPTQSIVMLPPQVRRRSNNVIQTIEINSPEIKIELYDDGIIDHDTVTVYFNGKAVVWKNMLTHHPISVTLTALPDRDNDLILYADNLGDIPPNTALMVVYAGDDKYDVRVTSDLSTNGEVKFRLKKGK